jgi:hypothetical protein
MTRQRPFTNGPKKITGTMHARHYGVISVKDDSVTVEMREQRTLDLRASC